MREKMTPVSFLFYTIFGLIAAAITGHCMNDADWRPEYRSYVQAHARWVKDRDAFAAGVVQRHFEEALAGLYPVEQLPDADLQEVARATRAWAKDHDALRGTTYEMRLKGAMELPRDIVHDDAGPRLYHRHWLRERLISSCSPCEFEPSVSILGDPHRLLLVLNGDRAGVRANLPTGSEFVQPEPTFPAGAPKTFERTWRDDARLWVWCSIFFMLAFLLSGLIIHAVVMDEKKDGEIPSFGSHPLAVPDFVLGWLVMIAFAPAFLVVHAFMASLRDVRPALDRARRFVRPGKFDDEFAALKLQLEELRSHEQQRGDSSLIRDIDAMIVKVGESQSQRHLAELRDALAAADRVRLALDEVNRDLGAGA